MNQMAVDFEVKLAQKKSEYDDLQAKYDQIKDFNQEKKILIEEISEFRKKIREMKVNFKKQLSLKDREKVRITDKIKKDMLHRI